MFLLFISFSSIYTMSSADVLVYDMSASPRVEPSVFVKKSWLQVLDDNAQNYSGNQITLQTSAISNSNTYVNMSEAYIQLPLIMTLTSATASAGKMAPATAGTSCDYTLGLRNWLGSLINSLSVEMNGSSLVQVTNFLPLYNNFKLMTTLSWDDVKLMSSAGFYPDDALSVSFQTGNSENGIGVSNNENGISFPTVTGAFNTYHKGNQGFLRRQMGFNYNPAGTTSSASNSATFGSLLSASYANQLYKSYIFTRQNATSSLKGVFQQALTGVVHLKHLSDIFAKMPLLKGAYLKLVMGVSNVSVDFTVASNIISGTTVQNTQGGICPLMIASALAGNGSRTLPDDTYTASLAVGGKCLNTTQLAISGVTSSPLAQSVTLNCPSYVFNPSAELAYLKDSVKRIVYKDIYQFTIQNVASGSNVNALVSNGIANMKKVICMPFFTASANGGGLSDLQSPFSGAGGGQTSPLAHIGAFNIAVSGANLFPTNVRYNYDMYQNHLYGIGAINGGQTDGLNSGLISPLDFETAYGYYVGDVSRDLEISKDIPKSLNILGQNLSAKEIDIFVFVEYETEITIDALTSSRIA